MLHTHLPIATMSTAITRTPTPMTLTHQPGNWLDPDPGTPVDQWLTEIGNVGEWVTVPLTTAIACAFSSVELKLTRPGGELLARGWASIDLTTQPDDGAMVDAATAAAVVVAEYGASAVDVTDPRWVHVRFDVVMTAPGLVQAQVIEQLHDGCPVDALASDVRGHRFWASCTAPGMFCDVAA